MAGQGFRPSRASFDDEDFPESLSLLQENRIASHRASGIAQIHQQVSQVNSMFKDLSQMVIAQGETVQTIEDNAESASSFTKRATMEIKITHDRRKHIKDAIFILGGFIMVVILLSLGSKLRHHPQN
jgi:t-SNARE complex subunit (syntaxin)